MESPTTKNEAVVGVTPDSEVSSVADREAITPVPLRIKFISILMVSAIGFGAHWSSGVTGAMKSTLKKELHINNTQFALLEASEDFMVMILILFSGIVTDRLGGAGTMLYGNIIYSIGSILVAAATTVRSYKFMIGGRVVLALGDIATQVAQYKVFSSWFPPSHGFAATLGLELGIGKIGGFVGKSTANVIAKKTGHFYWVFWTAVFMNVFTNVMTLVFYFFTRYTRKAYPIQADPATGEKLTEKNKKFEIRKVLELPWVFWCVLLFSAFQTSTAIVFSQNATELAEQRFDTDSVTAGWYSSLSQYAGFFVVPALGVFVDVFGNRISIMLLCGFGTFLSMALAAWGPTVSGTAASFGVYAVSVCFGPTTIIDSIRTSMWHQSVFGSAYAIKIALNNAMNIIIRIITGVIQDADDNKYDKVVIVYAIDAVLALVVGAVLFIVAFYSVDLGRLQWTRKERMLKGDVINQRRERFMNEKKARNSKVSIALFCAFLLLVAGAMVAYFWGVATGNN